MTDENEPEKPPASPWPSAHKREEGAATSVAPSPPPREKAAWGVPLDALDRAWTRLDARLCAAVLVAEVLTLVFWIAIKALSKTGHGGPGLVFRCMLCMILFGGIVAVATKSAKLRTREVATTWAVLVGIFVGRQLGDFGAEYFANLQAWMENASTLVFFGGIAEIAKRLTLWLALLGASVATGQGKHINVDVVMRFLSPRARVPVAVLGWMTAAIVSFAGAWGFFDNLAVEDFHVPTSQPCESATMHCPVPAMEKIHLVEDDIARDAFLVRKQIALDLWALPKVLGGTPYRSWLTPKEWNAWLRDGGWENHFKAEDVKALELPEDATDTRTPAVTAIPGATDQVINLLTPVCNLVFPFGLLVIAIRFVLRSLLAIAGFVKVDPNAAHADEDLEHAHDGSGEAAE